MKAEENRLIALFMGAKLSDHFIDQPTYSYDVAPTSHSSYHWTPEAMEYHERWDWLMPVVEKICDDHETDINIDADRVFLHLIGGDMQSFTNKDHGSKIEAVYASVIYFIEWYNTQNK